VIERVLRGESTLAVMPTGSGKSLCYQLPALMLPGVTLVVSPLVALMRDQREGLPPQAQGASTVLDHTLEAAEYQARLRGIARGYYRLVYAAPERLRQRPFVHALRAAGVSLVVVDEAHCISMWGHDFRPDYLFLSTAFASLGDPPVLAVTATATPAMQEEIRAALRRDFETVHLGAYRPNLELSVALAADDAEKNRRLVEICRSAEGSVLVYARTRTQTERLAETLREAGIAAGHYHAGLDSSSRAAAQDAFMAGKAAVLVATIAFGMGIDKPDIRHLIHVGLPGSLEAYHQEIGRAGRDGLPARCLLLYSRYDEEWSFQKSREDAPSADAILAVLGAVARLEEWGERLIALNDLERETEQSETAVRAALGILEHVGAMRRDFDAPRSLTLNVLDAAADAPFAEFVARARLRERQRISLDALELCDRVGMSPGDLEDQLLQWEARGYLEVRSSGRSLVLERLAAPDDPEIRERIAALAARIAEESRRRLLALHAYLEHRGCRHDYLGAHLGDPLDEPCGHCDRCRARRAVSPRRHGDTEKGARRTAFIENAKTRKDENAKVALPGEELSELSSVSLCLRGEKLPSAGPTVLACLAELPYSLSRADLARVLVGAPESPVLGDRSRHFGALSELGVAGIAALLDELLRTGLVIERWRLLGPELRLTQAGRRALRVAIGEAPAEPSARRPAPSAELLEQLHAWRQAQARAERRLPIFVLSNAALRAIARERPRTVTQLMALPGVGIERGRAYGPEILRLCAEGGADQR
jgi:ATP-dependent DNA helicase RecQ